MNSALHELANQITHEIQDLTAEELSRQPEGKWSIAEILEHLSLTYSGTKLGLDRCLQSGKPSGHVPSASDRVRAFVVTRLGYLPNGREAPAATRPKGRPVDEIRQDFVKKITSMEESIAESERRFGRSAKVLDHPFLGPFTSSEWRRFHSVHGRHHLRQIRQLRKWTEAKRGSET